MPGLSITDREELCPNGPMPDAAVERRFYPRTSAPISTFLTIAGIEVKLLDVSENGLSVATENGVAPNAVSRISIRLDGLATPIEVTSRVIWAAEAENRAGIQLLNLSEGDREQIRKWQTQGTTASTENSVCSIAPTPAARWIEKDEFLAGLAARSAAIENSAVDDADHGSKVAAAFAVSQPALPGDNPFFANPVSSDSSETRENVQTEATSRQLTVVAVVALILTLGFAAGAFVINSWLKSSIQVHHEQNKQLRGPVSHRPAPPPDVHGNLQVPNSSFTQPKLNNPTATDFPSAATPDTFRGSAQKIESRHGWNNKPVDAKNSAISRSPNSVKDTVPAAELSSSRHTSLPGQNEAGVPTNSSGITVSKDLSPVQDNSNATPLAQGASASAGSFVPDPNIGKSPREIENSISGSGHADSAISSKGAKENIPPAIFPNASSSTSVTTSALAPPEHRETRLTIPKNNSSPILQVSGERVLESPSGRIRIQRSIFVPDEHKWWWPLGKRKEKEVLLGELVSRTDPQPPRSVRGAQIVRVRAIVDRNGSVVELKPVSGAVELMPTVMRAVRQWHYRPTYVDGTRVETEAYISFEFRPSTHIAWR